MSTKPIFVEKNTGEKISVEVSGNTVILNEEMMLNLSKYERDYDVHIDICKNSFGMLTFGVSDRYAVEIDIPARAYDYIDDGEDAEGKPKTKKVAKPFDMSNVTVTLWGLEVNEEQEQTGGENNE